ncbi:MAG: AlbA family DNA-binding domain-containing protein, partial [bacterium]
MDKDVLVKLIRSGESETLELKKSVAELETGFKAVCAFANGGGGRVVFGVAPGGRVTGQPLTDANSQKIAVAVRKLEPPVEVVIESAELEPGQPVIVVQVAADPDSVPVVYEGKPYEKIGSTVSVRPQVTYQRLLLERMHSKRRWENETAEGVAPADLDQAELQAFFNAAVARGSLPQAEGEEVGQKLERLGLMFEGRLLNAAVVLFGRRFLPYYPQCQLQMARFKGVNKSS